MNATDHVWALRTTLGIDEVNLHLATLEAHGLLGLTEEGGRTSAWFPHRVADLKIPGDWETVRSGGWDESWRAALQPVAVGPFVITPPWKATGDAREIIIEPAQAFGTGHHETTTGCLRALCEIDVAGRSVLDVGTGTGVLAIAATRLGASRVVGCDVDPVAVSTARDNGIANNAKFLVVSGSVDAVPSGPFDIVVANIDTDAITALASQLINRTAEHLIVSGVSRERVDEAVAALRRAGVAPDVRVGREWVVLTGERI